MIYTFKEQTIIIFHFILLGIFLSMMIDSIHIFLNKIKIINYIIQFILWLIITYICIRYVNNISNGYIPFYFLLFFLIGYLIYTYFLKANYIKNMYLIKNNKEKILGILFPITLFKYIINKIKKRKIKKD